VEDTNTVRIADKKIGDNISITYFDRSRKITGDRWLVELTGEVEVAVSETFWATVHEPDSDLLECIRKRIGDHIHFSISRNRNFVDEKEKQKIFAELFGRFEENVAQYLDSPDFSHKLFVKHFNEAKEKCQTEGYRTPEPELPEDEDQGPADFSHLFK
jgi:hypothetical protein